MHVFATFGIGGPQIQTCRLLNHFAGAYSHSIIAMDGNVEAGARISRDVEVNFVSLSFRKQRTFRNLVLFRRTLRRINPDLLLTYNWGAIEWAMANYLFPACPHVHFERGFGPDEVAGQKARRALMRRVFLQRACKVVVPSLVLERIAVESWKVPAARLQYIPNSVNCSTYKVKCHKSDHDGEVILGTVTSLRQEKNIPRMMRAFARLAGTNGNARLWIVGEGPERAEIETLIAAYKLNNMVRMWGYVENPRELLAQMDIFVVSSDTEQMPNAVVEAMAAGLPVVGTDVGDVRHVVAALNKEYVVDKDNEPLLYDKIAVLASQPALRKALGEANRQRCREHYDWEGMAQSYRLLYETTGRGG